MNFTHLHVHSHYSLLDGMAKIKEIVDQCVATGMNSVALTDHGNMYGIKELLDYCKKINEKREIPFKPIVGIEAYCARRGRHSMTREEEVTPDDRRRIIDRGGWHLILLAKNLTGYRNLCRLVSESNKEDAFYYVPRIDHELLEQYHDGLICCSACIGGELPQKILAGIQSGDLAEAHKTVKWFKELFGEDYYIELQRHKSYRRSANRSTYKLQSIVNPVLVDLAHEYGIKLICTNDCHYVGKEDADAQDTLLCINTNKYYDDKDRLHYTKQEWLKSPEEMADLFSDIPEAIANTQEIVDRIEIYDIDSAPRIPVFDIPDGFKSDNAYLQHLVMEGAIQRYGKERTETDKVLEERINYELNTIAQAGISSYVLIVWDYIRVAREEMGLIVGPGRGSAACSVVNYCLRITDIDSLEYGLLFERFFNLQCTELPEIDIDIEDPGREKIINYLISRYGESHVARIITYGKMSHKMTLASVGHVLRVPQEHIDEIKSVFIPWDMSLKDSYQYIRKLQQESESKDPQIRKMLKYAARLENIVRQTSAYSYSVVLCKEKLADIVPMSRVEDSKHQRVMVTSYDGGTIDSVGPIRINVLDLLVFSVIKDCLHRIKQNRGIDLDINHIPIDDMDTFRIFQEGNTDGVFQFESQGIRKYLRELNPNDFKELIALNAMYRPGPMEFIPSYIRRKHGEEPITYELPIMEKYLNETFGVAIYQEQIMSLAQDIANFTPIESDELRKSICRLRHSEKTRALRDKFLENGFKNGYNEGALARIWNDWMRNAIYTFNKSHSVCYTWIAYQTAYLKAHFPNEFAESIAKFWK